MLLNEVKEEVNYQESKVKETRVGMVHSQQSFKTKGENEEAIKSASTVQEGKKRWRRRWIKYVQCKLN